jgi:hypothetical protein
MIIPLWVYIVGSVLLVFSSYCMWDRRGSDRMVVGFTTTHAISAYKFNHTNINDWHYSGTSRYRDIELENVLLKSYPTFYVNGNKVQETLENVYVRGKNKNIYIDTWKTR